MLFTCEFRKGANTNGRRLMTDKQIPKDLQKIMDKKNS